MTSKLLIATDEYVPYRGGIGRYCEEMAHAAIRMGLDVQVSAPAFGLPLGPQTQDGIRVHRHFGQSSTLRSLPNLILRLGLDLKRHPDSVFHLASWGSFLAGRFLGIQRRRKCVATFYGSELLALPSSKLFRTLRVESYVKGMDRLVAISSYTSDLLAKAYNVDRLRIIETPLGVSEFWRAEATEVAALRKKLALPDQMRVVSTVARIDRRKGQDIAIRALNLLPSDVVDSVVYVVAGNTVDQDYRTHLQTLADSSRVRLVFASGLTDSEVRCLYSITDVSIMSGAPHPSRVEGFGLVVLEANAQGAPVVVTPVGAIPEVVREGFNGTVSDSSSDEDVAAAILKTLKQFESGSISRRSCVRFSEGFTWDRTAELTYAQQ